MNDTMFNILDTVEDDDLIQVVPVRGGSSSAQPLKLSRLFPTGNSVFKNLIQLPIRLSSVNIG